MKFQMFELTLWLALTLLGSRALLASGQSNNAGGLSFEQSSGLLGITFPVAQTDDGGGGTGSEAESRLESLKRALLLRELELEGSLQARQLSNRELMRRVRLNQLLDAISASIPAASPTAAPQNSNQAAAQNSQQAAAATAQQASSGSSASAPIYRSGRTYPSRDGDNYRRLRLASTGDYASALRGPSSAWDSAALAAGMLDGGPPAPKPTSSRKSGILGIVWPNDRLGSGGVPPFYSSPTAASATSNLSTVYGGRAGQLHDQQQQRAMSGNGAQQQQQPAAATQRHRSGSEEVALQGSPSLRSQSQSADYEWKRMETSRWNNLRGMWGKRAALRDDEIEQLDGASRAQAENNMASEGGAAADERSGARKASQDEEQAVGSGPM